MTESFDIALAFDTAAPVIGVGLYVKGRVRTRTERIRAGSETRLLPFVQELLAEAELPASAVELVVVASGPGAFTGLRVGLATAGGLAQALEVPVVACSSLASRARAAGGPMDRPLVAMLDARKNRVYSQTWYPDGRVSEPGDLLPEAAWADLQGSFRATGEGAVVYREQVEAAGGSLVSEPLRPGLSGLAELGVQRAAEGMTLPPWQLRPEYLREPDAVRRS